jgi:hypothetical protein
MTFKCLQYTHSLFFNKILVTLFQTTCNEYPMSPFSHLLVWYLIIVLGIYTLGLDFLSMSDMVVGAVCHLFQHYSPSNVFITSCLWQQIILGIISLVRCFTLQICASWNTVYSCCFTVVCLFCMFSHHNLILQIITQYLSCFSQCSLSHLYPLSWHYLPYFEEGHLG